jgi:hypothetical protein
MAKPSRNIKEKKQGGKRKIKKGGKEEKNI